MEILDKNRYPEYEKFVETSPKGHFTQSILWSKVKTAWKWEAVVARNENGEIVGSIGVLIRRPPFLPYSLMYAPRGPVCDIHDKKVLRDLVEGVKALAKKHRAYVFRMDPDVKSSDAEFVQTMKELGFAVKEESKTFDAVQPRYVFRLDIEGKSEEDVQALFHSKTRYNIRVALKNNVTVKIGSREDIARFYQIMIETGMRDHFVTRSQQYFETMYDALGEHMRLYMAYYEGMAVAGTLCIWYGDKVWYLYGASSNESRNVMPNYLLQWEMIRWAVENKCRVYDFRGVAGILDESHPLYGLYRFKKGFGGEFTEFVGELSFAPKPLVNRAVKAAEKLYRRYIKLAYRLKNGGKKSGEKDSNEKDHR